MSKSKAQPRTIGHELHNAFRKVLRSGKLPPDVTVWAFIAWELRGVRLACEKIAKELEEEELDVDDLGGSAEPVPPGFEGMPPPQLTPDQVAAMMHDSDLLTLQRVVPALLQSDALKYGELDAFASALAAGDVDALETINEIYKGTTTPESMAAELAAVGRPSLEERGDDELDELDEGVTDEPG